MQINKALVMVKKGKLSQEGEQNDLKKLLDIYCNFGMTIIVT